MSKLAENIKESLDLREVMERYGIRFNRSGHAICPFHKEKTASLSIKNKRFTCFGCGATGDVIDFVKMYFNLNFGQVLIRLNNDFQLGLTNEKPTAKSRAMAKERMERRRQEMAEKETFRKAYIKICGAHARLLRSGAEKALLDQIEYWLDENIEMVVVR